MKESIKQLREQTGAGILDCKKALVETDGDIEQAVDWLRKKGLLKAAKKEGRVAAEGLVGVALAPGQGAIVELNSETDFVARNEQFQAVVKKLSHEVLETKKTFDALMAGSFAHDAAQTVQAEVQELAVRVGENVTFRRSSFLTGDVVVAYVHNQAAPNMGRIGVLVAFEGGASHKEFVEDFGRKVAMHIAAMKPMALDKESMSPDVVKRERAILEEQAKAMGRQENMLEKIIEGRIRKFYEENVLLLQKFVVDSEKTVEGALSALCETLGAPIKIKAFCCFILGEGVKKEDSQAGAPDAMSS